MFGKNKENCLQEMIQLKEHWKEEQKKYITGNVTIGDYTYGYPKILSFGDDTKLSIGKFCSISENVTFLLGGEHRSDWGSTYPFNCLLDSFSKIKGHPKTKGDIVVGNDVWIASGAKILSGVCIDDGAIIGANSLVTKDVPAYSICAGNPARIIKYRFPDDIIKDLLTIKWWNLNEKKIIEIIPLLQSNNMEKLIRKLKN